MPRPDILLAILALVGTATSARTASADVPARPDAVKGWPATPFEADPAAVRAAADARPPTPDDAVTRLYEERVYTLSATGALESHTARVSRVDDPSSIRSMSTFGANWTPATMARPEIRARVIDRQGRAHAHDPSQIAEEASGETGPDIFSDSRQLAAPLPRLRVGSISEVEARFKETGPVFTSGRRIALSLDNHGRWSHRRLEVRAPVDAGVKVAVVDSDIELAVSTEGDMQVWRADVFLDPERSASDASLDYDAPYDASPAPRFVVGTTPSWAAAAAEYVEVVEAALAARPSEAAAGEEGDVIRTWGAALPRDDARAAARILAAQIHDRVRYTGVHFGRAATIPRTPSEVVRAGFGDCKDLAVLFVGAMRAAGYGAHVALVRAEGPPIEANVPGLGAFDHAIAHVEADPPLWVDLTAPSLPAGELSTPLFGRRALLIAPETRGLVRLPRPEAKDNVRTVEHHWRLSSTAPGRLRVTQTRRGPAAYLFRSEPGTWARSIEAPYAEAVRHIFETGDDAEVEVEPPADPLAETLRVVAEVESPLGWTNGPRSGVWYTTDELFALLPRAMRSSTEGKARPMYLHAPGQATYTLRVDPPPGHVLVQGPTEGRHALGPATLTIERHDLPDAPEGAVAWTWHLESGPRAWTTEQVEALRAAVSPFANVDERFGVQFQHRGAHALDRGRIGEGLRIYRALAVDDDPGAQLDYIEMLTQHGYTHAARTLAARFVERHPEHPRGWRVLGLTHLTGDLGGVLTPGVDRAGAIAALERADALEPAAEKTVLALAWAHGGQPIGWLPDAAAREKALSIARPVPELAGVAADLALSLGRPGEALTLLGQTRTLESAAVRLAATILEHGIDAGLMTLRAAQLGGEDRRAVLTAASIMLANARRYDAMAALAARESDATHEQPGLEALGGIEPFTPAAPDTPVAALAGLIHHLLLESDASRLTAFATPEVVGLLPGSSLETALTGSVRKLTDDLGLWPRALADALGRERYVIKPVPLSGAAWVTTESLWGTYAAIVEQTPRGPRVAAVPGDTPVIFGRRMADALARGDEQTAFLWRLLSIVGAEPVRDPFRSTARPTLLAARLTSISGVPLAWVAAALLGAGEPADRARARALVASAEVATAVDDPETRHGLAALTLSLTDAPAARRAVLEALVERHPDDTTLATHYMSHLTSVGAFEDARRFAAARPPQVADSAMGWIANWDLANREGRVAEIDEVGRRLLDSPIGDWVDNNLAWNALFMPEADLQEAVGWLTDDKELSRVELHTLATLYGHIGDADRTRATMNAMFAKSPTFGSHDWLVVGLLAAAEGLPEIARDAFARLPVEPDDGPSASSRLARRALDRLDAAPAP